MVVATPLADFKLRTTDLYVSAFLLARGHRLLDVVGDTPSRPSRLAWALLAFAAKILPVIRDWQEHLMRNKQTAAQVLRKIIPHRLTVRPQPEGGWQIEGDCEYTALLRECGLDAVKAVLETVAKQKGSRARRGWHRGPRTG